MGGEHVSVCREEDDMDSILCFPGPTLIQSGITSVPSRESHVVFVNCGGGAIKKEGNSAVCVEQDCCFQGGDVLRTEESIINGGDLPSLYQSARFGKNLSYTFKDLSPGEYMVDLHFAEIVYTNGPRGMRVLDVFIQAEKVISELDIYSIVGANKPLRVENVRVSVGEEREICLTLKGVVGSSIVSGICLKMAAEPSLSQEKYEYINCHNCTAEVKISSDQNKATRMKSIAKYEKKIEELRAQCQQKADECYQAWMSLTVANEQLEKVTVELDNKFFQNICLGQEMEKQTATLRDLSTRYERDKRLCIGAIDELEKKLQVMKIEHSQLSWEAHELASSSPDLNKMISAVQAIVSQHDDLKLKFNEEQVKRKKLYNQVQEAKGNIRVFCRCRPMSKEEIAAGHQTVVDFSAAKDGDLGILSNGSTKKIFKFDRVFSPQNDQVDVFTDASPLVLSVLDGYNVCIFAYGQTGTGKTFTMEGTEHDRGVNYRTLQLLFQTAKERKDTVSYDISVSVLEVYNEQIRDLLATLPTARGLEIRQVSDGVHHLPGIVEAKVENIKEVWDVLQAGSNARAVGSNNVNEHSSRSHCLLCTMVRAKNLLNGECTMSKLWLVDLAGSERLAKTEVQGERLKEAQNINRSLSALGDVISSLATKSSHIPYRNSKLTHLLQDSLGGESKTLMFVQISPSLNDLGETISSLNFATRVRGVELGPAKKQTDMRELQKLKTMLDKAKQDLKSRDEAISKLEENFQNLEGKAKGKDQLFRNQQEKVNELESQLASKTALCGQLEKQVSQLSEGMKRKEAICLNYQQKVNELERKMKEYEEVESMNLQFKLKELEKRMKAREQEFELHSRMLQQKLKEAEGNLTRKRDNSESLLLEQKIKVLEEKVKRQEQQAADSVLISSSAENSKTTPILSRMEIIEDMDYPPTQRNSSSRYSSRTNQESSLLKGTDSLRELRRKRDTQNRGAENDIFLLEKKIFSADTNKAGHHDPPRALALITRSTKPVSSGEKGLPNRTTKDHLLRKKDGNNRLRIWLR